MFIKYFFTFVQDKPIVSISVCIFRRTLFLVEYFLKLLSMNVKMKSVAVVWCVEQNCVLKQVQGQNRRTFLRIWKTFDSVLLCFQRKWVFGRYSIENFVEISLPSNYLLVLKTSLTRLQCNNFTFSKSSWRRLAKTFWRHFGRRKIVTLKTSWRRVEDMPWGCLEEMLLKILWRQPNKLIGDIWILISG